MEAIKNEKYVKQCQKFASKEVFRPILTSVLLESDGSMIATDAHRLIRITEAHTLTERTLISNNYSLEAKSYPNVSHIVNANMPNKAKVVIKEWMDAHKILKQQFVEWEQKKERHVHMVATGDTITFKIKQDDGDFTYQVEVSNYGVEYSLHYDLKYMQDALNTHKALGHKEVYFKYSDKQLLPFALEAGNVFTLLMPIRKAMQ